jgi:energy-coupling factor transport system ATP-binding protein
MEILSLENLSFRYPTEEKDTLSNITFSLDEGDFCVICGSSGGGKTTLMRLIKRELAPHGSLSGKIYFAGKEQSELSAREPTLRVTPILG